MRKLLLADDSVTIQRVIELTFSGEDIQVVAVNDGEQAIARIPAEQPDVVLADIGMPRKGGYDVAAFVKGRPDLSHIPVLLLAGAFEPVDQTRAEQVGADGVLIKPFEPRQVIERVKELLASVQPTISAEAVREPSAPGDTAAPASVPPAAPAALETAPLEPGPVPAAPIEPAVVEATHVEPPAAPQVQSLDELFASLNQAITERAAATAVPPPPAPLAAASHPLPVPEPPPAISSTPLVASHEEASPPGVFPPRPEAAWRAPIGLDSTPLDRPPVESAPFDTASRASASAATLDDYFDRLSAAFSYTGVGPSEGLPDRLEDFGNAAALEPPAASHEWLGQAREPEGLLAFENGEADDNPILSAVSTLMARTPSDHDTGSASHADHSFNGAYAAPPRGTGTTPTPPSSVAQAHAIEGTTTTPWNTEGVPATNTDLVDLVTERVLARLVPEITENLRRLVRQEIDRTR